MNERVGRRWDIVWNAVQKTETYLKECESSLRMNNADAKRMKEAGIICTASSHTTAGWVVPFTVVEDKPSGQRTRFLAWLKGNDAQDDCEADVPLGCISRYLDAVCDESATLFDLKASFFQVALPVKMRESFRCRTESGEPVELARLPMGYKCSPPILHTITRVLAGDPELVLPQCAAPKALKIHVLIDNTGISGPQEKE